MAWFSDDDKHWFNEGTHQRIYTKLGAHLDERNGETGVTFGTWAPNAECVFVMGSFNQWDHYATPMHHAGGGLWEVFVPGIGRGEHYKLFVVSRFNGYRVEKSDPVGFFHECPPKTASIVWDLNFQWHDDQWMAERRKHHHLGSAISVYEVHLGSWMRVPEEGDRSLNYRELAFRLGDYVKSMNFTHVELLPIMEHPFYGSWGYQTSGYFAPTHRFGTPDDFQFFVDHLHQLGIGVIIDWVPSHFPTDSHGLSYFDGTHLFEHADPKKGFHPDWKSAIFNYGRHEVRSFLLSSAMFWLDRYHIDGIRVDAVASMLYLDYSRGSDFIPNQFGGRENLDAISFLRQLNHDLYTNHPDILTVAEESTDWPMVSRPTYVGGLGFGFKWDMGWMHDTLVYMRKDPVFRRYHQNDITFRQIYAHTENFMLPLSHDEVVHMKGSLISQMSGSDWERFANLRLLFGYMFGQTGKKLLFMGGEFGQWGEWNHDRSLDWHLTHFEPHKGVQQWVRDLNHCLRNEPALHESDFAPGGFEWVNCHDSDNSVLSFIRVAPQHGDCFLIVCNFTPVPRFHYRVGVPRHGFWREVLNSDGAHYGGSGHGNWGGFYSDSIPWDGRPASLNLTLPPLGATYFKFMGA